MRAHGGNMHYFNFLGAEDRLFCPAIQRCLLGFGEDMGILKSVAGTPRRYEFADGSRRPEEPKDPRLKDLGETLYREYSSLAQSS